MDDIVIIPNVGVPLTGVSATGNVGAPEIISFPVIEPAGFQATASLGTVIIPNDAALISGVSATGSVGDISPADYLFYPS